MKLNLGSAVAGAARNWGGRGGGEWFRKHLVFTLLRMLHVHIQDHKKFVETEKFWIRRNECVWTTTYDRVQAKIARRHAEICNLLSSYACTTDRRRLHRLVFIVILETQPFAARFLILPSEWS